MKTISRNKGTNVSKNRTVIRNGMKFTREGKYLTFSGTVNTIDKFHNYTRLQTI
jgi:hypothetical protein